MNKILDKIADLLFAVLSGRYAVNSRIALFLKKVFNVDDLSSYTGLSKSKIYKLTQLKLIPTGNNKHIRQKFFNKDVIDVWLLGEPNVSDEYLERKFNEALIRGL